MNCRDDAVKCVHSILVYFCVVQRDHTWYSGAEQSRTEHTRMEQNTTEHNRDIQFRTERHSHLNICISPLLYVPDIRVLTNLCRRSFPDLLYPTLQICHLYLYLYVFNVCTYNLTTQPMSGGSHDNDIVPHTRASTADSR